MITRKTIEHSMEDKIIIGMIMSDKFIKEILPIYKPEYFTSLFAKIICDWVIDYYQSYEKAPKHHIKDIFDVEKQFLEETDITIIGIFLDKLSKQYTEDQEINEDYFIDKAIEYFRKKGLVFTKGRIDKFLNAGKIEEAENEIINYKKVAKQTSDWFNPLDDKNIIDVFESIGENLINIPGDFGKFIGNLERGWLISIVGAFKRGKCISEDNLVLLSNGKYKKIKDIFKDKNDKEIITLDNNNNFVSGNILDYFDNGIKPVYKITTRLGHSIEATKNHPLLTMFGWKKIEELKAGDSIAVPRRIPFFGNKKLDWIEIENIQYSGMKQTYDLTVDKTHCFIANDVIVHNSWMMEEIGIQGLLSGLKVALISMEMNKRNVTKRVLSRITALSPREKNVIIPCFDCLANQEDGCKSSLRKGKVGLQNFAGDFPKYNSNLNYIPCTSCRFLSNSEQQYKLSTWYETVTKEEFTLKNVRKIIKSFKNMWNNNLRVITFPRFSATLSDIKRQLDFLEYTEVFIPDVIIPDYAGIIRPERNYSKEYLALDDIWKGLAGLAEERHCVVITGSQVGRSELSKQQMEAEGLAGWIGQAAHIDKAFTINQTKEEKVRGLIRLNKLYDRHQDFNDFETCVILQSLDIGQVVLDSQII